MGIQTVSQAYTNEGRALGKNIFENGAFLISQRGTSFTNVSNGDYTVDRCSFRKDYTGSYTTNVSQNTNTGLKGFPNSILVTNKTATATSGGWYGVRFIMEKSKMQAIADAGSMTVSFWYRSNRTGTNAHTCVGDFQFGSAFTSTYTDGTNPWGNFTVAAANTWQKFTFTSRVTMTDNVAVAQNAVAFHITLGFFGTGSTTIAVDDYFEITGLQMEPGTVATPFEHRPISEYLSMCQRYYEKVSALASNMLATGQAGASSSGWLVVPVKVTKRTSATFSITGTVQVLNSTGAGVGGTFTLGSNGVDVYRLNLVGASGLTAGHALLMYADTDASLNFSAEL